MRRASLHLLAFAGALLLASAPGCKAPPQSSADPADSQERLNVLTNPSLYLDTSGFAFDDDASDYEQLRAMTVWNKSQFAVRGLEGDVIWLDDEGHRIGTSRFALTGTVPARGSRTFSLADGSMTSGTLSGGALRGAVSFTRVNVGE
ncbi:MAG TPA: hypothetical protein VGI39_24415 [Polyangiaceae bacterium]